MPSWKLLVRSLRHYSRSHLAVVLGVATAAAVLGGSLVVGDSVRGSLAASALARLGRATHAVESSRFFRTALARELVARPAFGARFDAAHALLALRGVATHATSRRRAGDVQVYGVDAGFWRFHGGDDPALGAGREALVSESLANALQARAGDPIVVRLHAGSEVPGSTLFGRRDDPAQGLRLSVKGVLERGSLGELSLRPRPAGVRAVFVPAATLERALGLSGRANVILVRAKEPDTPASVLEAALGEVVGPEDLGLRLRALPEAGALQLETESALVDDGLAETATAVAERQGLQVTRVFTYLANTIRCGSREVPYSLVAALDANALRQLAGREIASGGDATPPIVLNDWAAAELGAAPGDRVTLEYFLWREEGRLENGSADFELAAVVPMTGLAADPNLVPEYPGITESLHLADWDPPFPVELDRVRPQDEAYWDRHRATPKAFVPLAVAERLWGHRLGQLTGLRLVPVEGGALDEARDGFAAALVAELGRGVLASSPTRLAVVPVRELALEASHGSTDFGEYFTYFSFFLVVAGLLLAGLFFRLGLEQRLREVGLLEALGFSAARLRRQFLAEGLVLAGGGGLIGFVAAPGYAALVLAALRALWSDSLATRDLELHLAWRSPLVGSLGATLAALVAVAWTLRDLRRLTPRALLAGSLEPWAARKRRGRALVPVLLLLAALGLVAGSATGAVPPTPGFFGAGSLLLVAALVLARRLVAGRPRAPAAIGSVAGLGVRGVAFRPGRSVLCVALVAAATFVIVAVGAFRRDGAAQVEARDGEAGGYRLMAWSLVPLHHDPATDAGRAALGLDASTLEGVGVARFRASLGEDASCLNLYEPQRPTVLAPTPAFLREGRFAFQATLAETDAERANPWLLLEREREPDGAIPAIADGSALAYILHRKLGDVMRLGETGVRVRFVAALAPGLLQGEILMGERLFLEAFPEEAGYRFFLLDVPAARAAALGRALESRLADLGFEVEQTATRLADFHRVENTYIATFQALGALGLLLGTVGLATVLVRNALEQRGALALLRAVGYRPAHLTRMVVAENAALVGLGFLAGAVPALVAIAPMLVERRGTLPLALVGALLVGLAVTAALVSWGAVAFIRRLPLVESLRSE